MVFLHGMLAGENMRNIASKSLVSGVLFTDFLKCPSNILKWNIDVLGLYYFLGSRIYKELQIIEENEFRFHEQVCRQHFGWVKELNLNAVAPCANSVLMTGWIQLLLHALVCFVVDGVSQCFIIWLLQFGLILKKQSINNYLFVYPRKVWRARVNLFKICACFLTC